MTHRNCTADRDDAFCVPATGNGMKSHDAHDTFLHISGGYGNHDEVGEIHLAIHSNDGHNQGQSWFAVDELVTAIVTMHKGSALAEVHRLRAGGAS